MQPILMLALVGVAAATLGTGFLMVNEITLIVQQLGVGQQNLESPIDAAKIDFTVSQIVDERTGIIKNVITACSFHSDESIDGDARIICKLTNAEHDVVAEGEVTLNELVGYDASDTLQIPITLIPTPGANDVRNIKDVTLVVLGNNPTNDEPPGPP